MIFNDAAGCYDQIPPQLGDIALQRLGCPRSVAQAHTQAQRNMAHYIRIAAGVSKASIRFADKQGKKFVGKLWRQMLGPIGGIGQGGGGGPMIWIAIITVLLKAF